MGCDIHFAIERINFTFYRKSKIKNLLDSSEKIEKIWEAYYIDSYVFGGDPPEDEELEYINEFKILKYIHNDSLDFNIDRNYLLFEKLGGVRGDEENALAPDRGLPENVSDAIKYFRDVIWEHDAHSISWISLKELVDYGKDKWDIISRNFWLNIIKPMIDLNLPYEDVRLVFWFDN